MYFMFRMHHIRTARLVLLMSVIWCLLVKTPDKWVNVVDSC